MLRLVMPVVECPRCRKETEFTGNEFRPFCSERCKLIDFGSWADGDYSLPAETAELTEQEADMLERALEDKHQ